MYWYKSVLLSVVSVACVIALTSAMKCNLCQGKKDGPCGDPFDQEKVSTTCDASDLSLPTDKNIACTKTLAGEGGNITVWSLGRNYWGTASYA